MEDIFKSEREEGGATKIERKIQIHVKQFSYTRRVFLFLCQNQ